jgi:signal transduction histidine kinase
MESDPSLPWSQVAKFLRQHTHDVRNHLSSLDLEAAFLAEVSVNDPEASDSVKRLRNQIRQIAATLKEFSGKIAPARVTPAPVAARDLLAIWKDVSAGVEEMPEVEWKEMVQGEEVEADPMSLCAVFRELLSNAKLFGSQEIRVQVRGDGDRVEFELREKKETPVDPSHWGKMPLISTRRGGYGLGLWQAAGIVRANGGELLQRYEPDSQELVSIIRFPARVAALV